MYRSAPSAKAALQLRQCVGRPLGCFVIWYLVVFTGFSSIGSCVGSMSSPSCVCCWSSILTSWCYELCRCWSPLWSAPGLASIICWGAPELAAPSCWIGVLGGGSSPGGAGFVVWGHVGLDPCPLTRSGVASGWMGVLKPGPYGIVPYQSFPVRLSRPRPPLPFRGPSPGYPRVASNVRLVTRWDVPTCSPHIRCALTKCGVIVLCVLGVCICIQRV